MNGVEFIQRMRSLYPNLNVIIFGVTANSSAEVRSSFIKSGAMDYFTIPLIKEEINAKTFSAMRIIQKVEENAAQQKVIDKQIMYIKFDRNGLIIDASSAYLKRTGYLLEEIENLHCSENPVYKDDPSMKNIWSKVTNSRYVKGEAESKTKAGDIFYEEFDIKPIQDHTGDIVEYYYLSFDITDKKYIERLSITDELTQLYNRRHFDTTFKKELDRTKRSRDNFALIHLDIDYFKQFNDTYGHQEGDQVLQSVAKVLKDSAKRVSDAVFRIGREEFTIILTGMSGNEFQPYSDYIRKSMESQKIPHKTVILVNM